MYTVILSGLFSVIKILYNTFDDFDKVFLMDLLILLLAYSYRHVIISDTALICWVFFSGEPNKISKRINYRN